MLGPGPLFLVLATPGQPWKGEQTSGQMVLSLLSVKFAKMYMEIKIVLIKLNFSHWKEYKISVSVLQRCRPMDNTIQIILTCDNIHQKKQCKGKGLASKVSLMNRK